MSDVTKPTETVEAFKSDPVGANGLTHGDVPVAETNAAATTEVPEAFKDDPVGANGLTQGEAAKAVEEPVNKDETKITAEPVTKGTIGYKAPGLLKQLFYKKYYFWVGDEAVPASELSQYLRGEKPDVAHPTAAWSASTGKGLLYFSKTAESTKTPVGVLCLADASEIAKEGPNEFTFKINKHKHTFETKNSVERDGWLVAIKTAAEEAIAARDGITTTEAYKETLADLKKPVGSPAAAAAEKDADHKKEVGTAAAAGGAATAGAAAAVVADSEKDKKEEKKEEKKDEKKSRSQSRGKRSSVFGSLLGKKDEAEPKKEEKAEEVKDTNEADKAQAEPVVVAAEQPAVATTGTTAVATGTIAPVVEEAKPEPVEAEKETFVTPATTPAVETAPKTEDSTKSTKANKRASIFGSLFSKKDTEAAPAKEEEAVKPAEATEVTEVTEAKPEESAEKPEEPSAAVEVAAAGAAATVGAAGATAAATTTDKPAEKRRSSFFGFGGKEKATKDVTAHEAATEDTKVVETTKQEPLAPTPDDAKNPEDTTETKAPKAKSSSKLSDLLRRPSKALKERKAREKSPAPATETVAESAEEPKTNGGDVVVKDETTAVPATNGETPKTAEKTAIGDVVPEAITVGNPESTQQPSTVSASA